MMMTKETELLKAQAQFEETVKFFRQASNDGLRLDELERGLWRRLLAMGLAMLEAFVAQAGDGDMGETIEQDGQTLRRIDTLRSRRYLSIFGAVAISRRAYAVREKQQEHAPLDARLGLPEDEFSYVLKDWLQQSCVRDAFGEAVNWLGEMLELPLSVRSAEQINQRMAEEVEQFRLAQPVPSAREEAEVLVVTADGKGVPMRRPIEVRVRQGVRRRKGEKANKKQMAAVGAVYSIAPFVRTADDVIDEVQRRERAAERPRPQHKRVWAELSRMHEGEQLSGKERLFAEMAIQAHERDPQHRNPLVCLMDGETALWEMQRAWLPRAVGVLDLFHVLERLWDVAHCFHGEGSEAAETFVTHRLDMLLTGKVGYMIGGLRRLLAQSDLRGEKHRTVQKAIGYFDHNREHMRYDEYLAAGYPIGSGVAEGACRHLVKDRLERTGMRWTVNGAQAMLHLRALYLNGDWKSYLEHYIATEQTALYGQRAA
jgi:hypothetical protein